MYTTALKMSRQYVIQCLTNKLDITERKEYDKESSLSTGTVKP